MKKRRFISLALTVAVTSSLLIGCGTTSSSSTSDSTAAAATSAASTDASASGASVESGSTAEATTAGSTSMDFSGQSIEVDLGGELDDTSLKEFDSLVTKFTDETGAKINVVHNGDDHESIMKTRMASNSMPDIWSTHGWSTIRYNDFLMDLSDQPWVSNMDDAIGSVVTDKNGKVCSMPVTLWVYGFIYDKGVLDANGIDPYSIKTWADLTDACATLKAAGITPLEFGDKEGYALGGLLEMANSFYTIDGAPYPSNDALSDGTFDWTKNQEAIQAFADLYDAGYFNTDVFTTDQDSSLRAMGNDNVGFKVWASPQNINTVLTYFPDKQYGIIPVPAVKDGGNSAYTVGEGLALGISKDTKYADLCKAFLNYLAGNEVMTEFIKVNGNLPGMKGIDVPDNQSITLYNESVANTENITYSNFFDREYLPSGMWNIMEESMAIIFNSDVGSAGSKVQEASEHMQENYETLLQTNSAE